MEFTDGYFDSEDENDIDKEVNFYVANADIEQQKDLWLYTKESDSEIDFETDISHDTIQKSEKK